MYQKYTTLNEKSYLTVNNVILTTGYFDTDKSFFLIVRVLNCAQVSVIMAFELNTRGKRCAIDQWVRCLSLMKKVPGTSTRRCRVRCKILRNYYLKFP